MSMSYIHDIQKTENTVCLKYPKLHTESDLDDFDLNDILNHAGIIIKKYLTNKYLK